jgi:hypothetical protein
MMASMARAASASIVAACAAAVALSACVESVDFRNAASDAGSAADLGASSSDALAPPDAATADAAVTDDGLKMDRDLGTVDPSDADVDAGDGPEIHPDAMPDQDASDNACEQAGYECLDFATYGGVCPSPRVAEHLLDCPPLSGHARFCCSRI